MTSSDLKEQGNTTATSSTIEVNKRIKSADRTLCLRKLTDVWVGREGFPLQLDITDDETVANDKCFSIGGFHGTGHKVCLSFEASDASLAKAWLQDLRSLFVKSSQTDMEAMKRGAVFATYVEMRPAVTNLLPEKKESLFVWYDEDEGNGDADLRPNSLRGALYWQPMEEQKKATPAAEAASAAISCSSCSAVLTTDASFWCSVHCVLLCASCRDSRVNNSHSCPMQPLDKAATAAQTGLQAALVECKRMSNELQAQDKAMRAERDLLKESMQSVLELMKALSKETLDQADKHYAQVSQQSLPHKTLLASLMKEMSDLIQASDGEHKNDAQKQQVMVAALKLHSRAADFLSSASKQQKLESPDATNVGQASLDEFCRIVIEGVTLLRSNNSKST